MLSFYGRLARWLHPLRNALLVLVGIAAAAFLWVVAAYTGPAQESFMLLSVVAGLWALSASILARTFIEPPPVAQPGDGIARRLGKSFVRLLYWLLALVMTVLLAAVLYLSFKAGGLAMTELGAG